jgi:hypothetical protein
MLGKSQFVRRYGALLVTLVTGISLCQTAGISIHLVDIAGKSGLRVMNTSGGHDKKAYIL